MICVKQAVSSQKAFCLGFSTGFSTHNLQSMLKKPLECGDIKVFFVCEKSRLPRMHKYSPKRLLLVCVVDVFNSLLHSLLFRENIYFRQLCAVFFTISSSFKEVDRSSCLARVDVRCNQAKEYAQ